MTLWHLLAAVALIGPVFSSLQTAHSLNTGLGGYAASALSGVLLGFVFSAILWLTTKRVFLRFTTSSATMQTLMAVLIFSTDILWITMAVWSAECSCPALLHAI